MFLADMLDKSSDVHVRALDWTDSVDPDRQAYVHSLLEEIDADVILAADVVGPCCRLGLDRNKHAREI
jgi:hypothetical protein